MHRYRVDKSEEPIVVENAIRTNNNIFTDWFGVATHFVKIRKIADETPSVLTKILNDVQVVPGPEGNVPISDSEYAPSHNLLGAADYEQIYGHLSALVGSRSLSRTKRYFLFK